MSTHPGKSREKKCACDTSAGTHKIHGNHYCNQGNSSRLGPAAAENLTRDFAEAFTGSPPRAAVDFNTRQARAGWGIAERRARVGDAPDGGISAGRGACPRRGGPAWASHRRARPGATSPPGPSASVRPVRPDRPAVADRTAQGDSSTIRFRFVSVQSTVHLGGGVRIGRAWPRSAPRYRAGISPASVPSASSSSSPGCRRRWACRARAGAARSPPARTANSARAAPTATPTSSTAPLTSATAHRGRQHPHQEDHAPDARPSRLRPPPHRRDLWTTCSSGFRNGPVPR